MNGWARLINIFHLIYQNHVWIKYWIKYCMAIDLVLLLTYKTGTLKHKPILGKHTHASLHKAYWALTVGSNSVRPFIWYIKLEISYKKTNFCLFLRNSHLPIEKWLTIIQFLTDFHNFFRMYLELKDLKNKLLMRWIWEHVNFKVQYSLPLLKNGQKIPKFSLIVFVHFLTNRLK